MALISLQEITLAFGGPLIFDHMSLQLEKGERVALLGRNGVGKTTLMKVMAGQTKVDEGSVIYQKGIKVAHLPQEVPAGISGNVFDLVLSGLGGRVKLLSDYHHVNHRLQTEYSEELMKQLGDLQSEMDHSNGWETASQVEEVIAHMKLDPEADFQKLSGGQKKRALLGKALIMKPEILMLDEPTNHLDIEAIDWLESFLKTYPGTVIFVTHDRMFMQHLATKIVELDRAKLYSWSCDYQTFLERKEIALNAEASERERFDKKMAEEEIWIRQGIKARRTRNEGRVKALERMREAKRAERKQVGQVKMKVQEAGDSGQRVIKVDHLYHTYDDLYLIKDFTAKIIRGDKIGVIGPNGSGKTTLLKLLLGQMPPQRGTVHLGTNLEISYYDQLREQLDEDKSVAQNVADSDFVTVDGKRRHILGYLQDFLFSPERARTPVRVLSGGERNRLFLARLFTKPSNLLVMDEPTNDLDVETLELLEELLVAYTGTLLLVSHDRAFLNNVVTSTLVLEGNGIINEYPGGYDDWLSQRPEPGAPAKKDKEPEKKEVPKPKRPASVKNLSMKEKKEWESLPSEIEKLEAEEGKLIELMGEREFYKKDPKEIADTKEKLQQTMELLLEAYKKWEYYESLH